jgi:NhaP-type Na+/H+ or K+/H+ antiporter
MNSLLNTLPIAALSPSRTLFELGLVGVLAAASPLIGQVLRLPSILVLLALGFGAGAVGALDPNALLGQQVISAGVSIAVGIILFEAGLGLELSKLTSAVAQVYRRLVTLGILVTWAIGTVTAYLLFNLSFEVALVLGAVLVVSGPTVVGPLLDFIRPSKEVNFVLKWEGTLADPIGATLGVVVFSAVVAGHATAGQEVFQFLLNVGVGVGFGVAGAVLIVAWAAWFKPNQSQAVTGTLMFVVAMVVGANLLRDDSGLITGLVIGAILVNRPPRGTEPQGVAIQRAKLARSWRERIATLSTFLIGILFIILSGRVTPHQIAQVGWVSIAFVAVLVFLGRPLAVALSTFGSSLHWRDRAFIAWMAPRGIVAAATSSTFALGLSQAGIGGGAQKLIPITFIVIVATALIYGLSGGPVARALGVARTGPGGVLLLGSSPVGRAIGRALQARGLTVLMWTAKEEHVRAAEADGLMVYKGDPTQNATESVPSDLDGLDYALAVGDDDAFNAMIATDLSEYFGRGHVFQLPISDRRAAGFETRVPILFEGSATHEELLTRIEAGGEISVVEPTGANGQKDLRAGLGANGIPMFVLAPGKHLHVVTAGDPTEVHEAQELIGLRG